MGWNDHLPELDGYANEVIVESGAAKPCQLHSDILLDQGDPDANRRSFAIGTNRWKKGDLECSREDFMDAVQTALDNTVDSCSSCRNLMRG